MASKCSELRTAIDSEDAGMELRVTILCTGQKDERRRYIRLAEILRPLSGVTVRLAFSFTQNDVIVWKLSLGNGTSWSTFKFSDLSRYVGNLERQWMTINVSILPKVTHSTTNVTADKLDFS
jgi:hypothetical protein